MQLITKKMLSNAKTDFSHYFYLLLIAALFSYNVMLVKYVFVYFHVYLKNAWLFIGYNIILKS